MVSFSFVLMATVVVITLLLSLSHCDANSTRGLKNIAPAGDSVAAEEKTSDDTRGGRKLMLDWRQLRRKVKKAEEISKVGDDDEDKSASKNSGASSVGNSNHTLMKREMKMEKLSSRSVYHHTKINPSGFMALNADYHMARPHPPRNN